MLSANVFFMNLKQHIFGPNCAKSRADPPDLTHAEELRGGEEGSEKGAGVFADLLRR